MLLFQPASLGVSSLSFNVFIILHSQYHDVSLLRQWTSFCSLSHIMESHAFKFSLKISSSQIYISNHRFFPEVHIPISNIEADVFIGGLTRVLCSTDPTLIYGTLNPPSPHVNQGHHHSASCTGRETQRLSCIPSLSHPLLLIHQPLLLFLQNIF